MAINKFRHVKFLEKKCGTTRGKSVIFFWKIRFEVLNAFCLPHVYGRRQSRRERCWNAYCKPCSTPAAGYNPVKRSCIFCIKIWPASIPYSFFCWSNPWRWFAFRHLCWLYQVIQLLGLFVPVLFGLHSSPSLISIFSDFEMLYLTSIRNYQASLRYQYWSLTQTWSTLAGIVRSRENAKLIFLGNFRQIITRNGF